MSAQREDSIPHELRTAAEPRQNRLYPVRLSHVEQVNPSVRLLQLAIPENNSDQQSFAFLPGQWLDVHIPSIAHAGGFTITSTPADAQVLPALEAAAESAPGEETSPSIESQGRPPYVELAVQDSPGNPSAAWFWRPQQEILGQELNIRVGGSFIWPPTGLNLADIQNVVFIAGGPSHLHPLSSQHSTHSPPQHPFPILQPPPPGHDKITSLETTLDQILFLPRLRQIIRSQLHSHRLRIALDLFLTNTDASSRLISTESPADLTIHPKRITAHDLRSAVVGGDGQADPRGTVCYVCGPPSMTDEMVELLNEILGEAAEQRIFFEKWW
ncbi:Riboflavin synthase-like beta-barrel [Penicillium alfredii]|uniref:Riboflavin synthase-like beta-barrel n=1 Tax=Penicillium alfredii TaxID=1506179 RepID=A0A9W9ERK4_9EURO|nr:Riboflavin synthase-like beta-barrel [Penicillium alfredii]KAJ5086707.1 Riboflavin synthase-like beta-barrel [Penicillium alfredii]